MPPFGEETRQRLVQAYDDSVRYADEFLKRLRKEITGPDTVLAVHGDHGEAFGEHGTYGHHPFLYDENIHVPLVIEGVDACHNTSKPLSLRKMPSILSNAVRGKLLSFDSEPAECWSPDGNRFGLRGHNWKYIYDDGEDFLYDLKSGETEEIIDNELYRKCRSTANNWFSSMLERRRIVRASNKIMIQ